ncbi:MULTISPECIES: GNAT family N-acetyltransferase [unclassified Mesorhizobium]|uniref:GNAT family N-acetyltransferase n=1 Tax=unclassified Mesorhizobium TaxID=325217 RepID=UPI000BAEA608|nr:MULTISPECIES: GNAT family N-acetyltransferase [unclassified Mesorhizobium]PBB28180.1 GNAT family N-acetyltransferase [Mesorhizobium sp. WSM4304]PBB75289.1 GNAT family N-acetyltransferase [Mesorhizobium sp. WSM4308]
MKRTVRTLSLGELTDLIDWAAAEGWNPGLEDAAMFQAADPEGFIGAFVRDEMVAAISAVAYGQDFGFIGLYICRPDMRGNGHGKAVWTAGMDRLAGRTIGLDGVEEQQANYRSKGFEPVYETIRYSGRPAALPVRAERPSMASAHPTPDIIAYDALCFPAPRRSFLQRWLQPPHHHAVTAITSRGTAGYAVARACRSGFKIGPLFADDEQTALELLGELAGACKGGELNIDVPATQVDFIAALEAAGFTPTFSTTRMYKGAPPRLDAKRVFGVTTLELG